MGGVLIFLKNKNNKLRIIPQKSLLIKNKEKENRKNLSMIFLKFELSSKLLQDCFLKFI